MIYLTGDIHGEVSVRFNPVMMPGEENWTAADKLIVLGDFGLIFYPETDAEHMAAEKEKIAFLEAKPYEILFVDGNHENFDRLFAFPEEPRYGGTVRRICKNVFWLQRGQIYTIENKTFFCFGGAYSIDRARRIPHESWWPQELPQKEERDRAFAVLEAHGNRVDYILTHNCPLAIYSRMQCYPDVHEEAFVMFLHDLWKSTEYNYWYFGHWHIDEDFPPKAAALFLDVVDLASGQRLYPPETGPGAYEGEPEE